MPSPARIDELQNKFAENPRRYFAPLADEYRKSGDLATAVEICRAHLAQQPAHMSGHIVLGKALYELGDFGEAREVFETALGLDPENLIALRHLGDIASQQGDPRTARQWYERVLEADPRNDEIAAQLRLLDEGAGASAAGAPAAAGVPRDAGTAAIQPMTFEALDLEPDTLAEGTAADGSLPGALEPSALAYMADAAPPVPGSGPVDDRFEALDLDLPATAAAEPGAAHGRADDAAVFDAGFGAMDSIDSPPPRQAADAASSADLDFAGFGMDDVEGARPDAAAGAHVPAAAGLDLPDLAPPARASAVDIGFEPMEFEAPAASGGSIAPAEGLESASFEFQPHVVQGTTDTGAPTPAAFVTETMAELYLQQGFHEEALGVYRQLLAADPTDASLRDRVAQLEGGGRTSLSMAALDDGIVRAAQDRQSRTMRRSARAFFSNLAVRRAPGQAPRGSEAFGATGYATDADERSPYETSPGDVAVGDETRDGARDAMAFAGATDDRMSDVPDTLAQETAADGTLPEAVEPSALAYLADAADEMTGDGYGDAAEVAPPAESSHAFDVAAYEADAWGLPDGSRQETPDAAAGPGHAGSGPADGAFGTPAFGTPAVGGPAIGYGGALGQPTPPSSGAVPAPSSVKGSLDALFGGSAGSADESAASALAGAFGGGDVARGASPAARPATSELSLDQVFRETPRRSEAQRREASAFSFDQFFSDSAGGAAAEPAPDAPSEEPPPEASADIEQFTAWLEGLKKK